MKIIEKMKDQTVVNEGELIYYDKELNKKTDDLHDLDIKLVEKQQKLVNMS